MKISVIVSFILASRFLKADHADLQVSDLTSLLATPVAQDIAILLTERSPYHSYPIANVTAADDGETLVFDIETDYFDRLSHYDKDEDFEVLWNVFNNHGTIEEFVVESTPAYEIEDEIKYLLHKEDVIGKFFEEDECYMDIKPEGHEIKDFDRFGLRKPDGLVYRFTVTIE